MPRQIAAIAPPAKSTTVHQLADEIHLRVLQQGSVSRMLAPLFESIADQHQAGAWHVPQGAMWEGLAVIEIYRARETEQIGELVDQLHQRIEDAQ